MRAAKQYYVFEGLKSLGLGATVVAYVPFLLEIGLSLSEVALVNAIFMAVTMVSEIPTGMCADGKGRAFSLKLGVVFWGLGAVAYIAAIGFWSAALAESLIAIGSAFLSGAQQAWIKDALIREGRVKDLLHVNANASIVRGCMMLGGGVIGAVLSLIHSRLLFVPLAILSVVAALFVSKYMNGIGEPPERLTELEALKRSSSLLRQRSDLKWVLLAFIVFGAVVALNHFWAPFFEPQVGRMGLAGVWVIIYLSFIPSGLWIRRMNKNMEQSKEVFYIVLAVGLSGIGMLGAGLTAGWVLPLAAVAVHELGRGMFQPLVDTFTQHRVPSNQLATFVSLQAFIGKIGFIITPIVVALSINGMPDTPATISLVWIAAGTALVFGATVLWVLRPRNDKA